MASASAISASDLSIRPSASSGRSTRRSTSSSGAGHGHADSEIQGVWLLIENLWSYSSKPTTDPAVSVLIQKLKAQLAMLDDSAKHRVQERLKNRTCVVGTVYAPETVGAFLCGCFMADSAYGTLRPRCTALCAGSPFSTDDCHQTVLHWMRDPRTGQLVSRHMAGKSSACNVFIDSNVQVSQQQKDEFLTRAGCRTVSYYNSTNSMPTSAMGPAIVPAQPTNPTVATTPGAAVNNPSPGVASGAAGTTPTVISTGGPSLWVIFAIVIFIVIVLLIIFLLWRYRREWYH